MPQTTVSIFDTTLRDGEQSPGCSMNLTEKVRMANKLQDLGVDIIEAGFPIASDGDFAAVKAIAAQCQNVKVAALCRTAEQDVVRAAEALKYAARPRIHTFCATSDIHLEHKLKKTRAEVLEMTRRVTQWAPRRLRLGRPAGGERAGHGGWPRVCCPLRVAWGARGAGPPTGHGLPAICSCYGTRRRRGRFTRRGGGARGWRRRPRR